MIREYKPIQHGLLSLINKYKEGVRKDGGIPNNSEFVKRCLTRYGLPGAFQGYVRINERRADRQRTLLENNFAQGKQTPELLKNVENKLLTLLFEFVVTPVEIAATMVGQGKKVQKLNQSLGAADWENEKNSGNKPESHELPQEYIQKHGRY